MRHRVIAMTVLLAGVTYLDRIAIGVLAPQIRKDLGLSMQQMSMVFFVFSVAYGVFEVPTAAWADRIGARSVVTRIVLWWSLFTIATAGAWNYISMLVIRFLFGAGEAGAWPSVGRVYSRWIPARERGKTQGVFFAGAHLAGAITPGIVYWLLRYMEWRMVFVVFGILGMLWALSWWLWFRDEPRDKAGTSPEEVKLIESGRGLAVNAHGNWKVVFKNPSVIWLCVSHFANTYGTFFVMTWMPTYLKEGRGMSTEHVVIFAGLPMLFAVPADLAGGWTTDYVTRRLGLSWGRAGVAGASYFTAMLAMFFGAAAPDPHISGVLLALAYGLSMFSLGAAFSFCIDIGKENSAVMTATMNTAGQVGGALSPVVLAWVVQNTGNWTLPLYIMSGLYLCAVMAWWMIGRQVRDTVIDGQH
ncbi:MFS transporter [Bryobacter aggregatus]|uniref:MFS transporter n=1 Tax=Bryobacter aggregatus TaxID=360054 RepID=UPI001EE25709|nr:MFS transporter [Bryobacter aggregatus]